MFGSQGLFGFGGIRIIYSELALKETTERLFPASKYRSKRIHKKLVKRFGGEFKKEPCIFEYEGRFIAHPSFKAEIERQLRRKNEEALNGAEQVVPVHEPREGVRYPLLGGLGLFGGYGTILTKTLAT